MIPPQRSRLWPLSTSALMAEAVAVGLKTQDRLPITERNSTLMKWLWERANFDSAHAEERHLSVRVQTHNGRRTCQIHCHIRPGDLMWVRSPGAQCAKQQYTLGVLDVEAQRLHEISTADADRCGIQITMLGRPAPEDAYAGLLSQMSTRTRRRWEATELHGETLSRCPTRRDLFAAYWELHYGPGSWLANPWVWVIKFEPFRMAPRAALKLATDRALRAERI